MNNHILVLPPIKSRSRHDNRWNCVTQLCDLPINYSQLSSSHPHIGSKFKPNINPKSYREVSSLEAKPIEHLKDLLTHIFSISSYDTFCWPSSVSHCMLNGSFIYHYMQMLSRLISLLILLFTIMSARFKFPICFHAPSVLCNMQPVWFWKSLATLRANKFHSRVCGQEFKSGWKPH